MNGAFVGTWSLAPHAPDPLQHDLAWTQSESGRPLSLSLPFTPGNAPHRGNNVNTHFDGLLPESNDVRDRLARRFNNRIHPSVRLARRDWPGLRRRPGNPPPTAQALPAQRPCRPRP
jgi:HipA-like protein